MPAASHPLPTTPHAALRRALRGLGIAALLAGLIWAGAVAALWFWQERLLFHPQPLPADARLAHAPDVVERSVDVPGARLSVLELRRPDPDGVVFFLHGNAGNLQTWFTGGGLYRDANVDLVMMDYRGFGKSSGRITSEAELHADVEAVWQAVAPRYAGKRVIVLGRSLGSGLAAHWAARHQPDLTVLVSPYFSMQALAAEHYPWVPQAVLRYPLRTDEALPRIRQPVLLLHGDRDGLIPLAHSERLAARNPHARLVVIPGAAHGDLQRFDAYAQALAAALRGRPHAPSAAAR